MSLAWKLASNNIQKVQDAQKKSYDEKARNVDLHAEECVMELMPSEIWGREWKLGRPFHGPYPVIHVTATNIKMRLVN